MIALAAEFNHSKCALHAQIDDFKKGGAAKFNACNDLLRCIRVGLKTVTVSHFFV